VVAILAGLAFTAAMTMLLTFFVTGNARADRAGNVFFLLFYALAAIVVAQLHARYVDLTALVWAPTAVALVALVVLFTSQALVLAGRVDFRRVAVLQTAGFGVYVLWLLAASVLVIAFGGLPLVLGWLGLAAVAVTLAALAVFGRDPAVIRGDRPPGRIEALFGFAPLLAIAAWLIVLGLSA